MDVDTFINQTNGVHIDEDGYYGAQCWDLVARYARVVVGCPSFPTGSGGAEGLFRIFADPIPQFFDRIANDTNNANQLPQKGDIIVWQASYSPPWGHTALCISANSSGVTVLEQNGNNPGGVSYIKTRSFVGISGWLRPKKGANVETFQDANDVRVNGYGLFGIDQPGSVNGGQANPVLTVWIGKPKLDFYKGLGAQVVNNQNAMQNQVNDLTAQLAAEQKAHAQDVQGLQAQVTDLTDKFTKLQTSFDELLKADKLKDQRIIDLQKQVPTSGTVEQPVVSKSIWDVIKDFLSQFKKG